MKLLETQDLDKSGKRAKFETKSYDYPIPLYLGNDKLYERYSEVNRLRLHQL